MTLKPFSKLLLDVLMNFENLKIGAFCQNYEQNPVLLQKIERTDLPPSVKVIF